MSQYTLANKPKHHLRYTIYLVATNPYIQAFDSHGPRPFHAMKRSSSSMKWSSSSMKRSFHGIKRGKRPTSQWRCRYGRLIIRIKHMLQRKKGRMVTISQVTHCYIAGLTMWRGIIPSFRRRETMRQVLPQSRLLLFDNSEMRDKYSYQFNHRFDVKFC